MRVARPMARSACAAWSSNAGAALPRCDANAASARSSSTRARWSSSIGPVSAVARRLESRVEGAGLEARLRRRQSAIRLPQGIVRSVRRRAGRNAAAAASPPRACARPAERSSSSGDLFVRSGRGCGQVPRAAVRIGVPLGCRRQARHEQPGVPAPAPIGRRRSVPAGDGTSRARRWPAGRAPRACSAAAGPMASRSAARHQQQRIADRLRRREQHQAPRVIGERLELVGRSSPRSVLSAPARPAGRSRPPTASPSARAAARATPADSRASRR